jgi:hypothetical protein
MARLTEFHRQQLEMMKFRHDYMRLTGEYENFTHLPDESIDALF